MIQKNESAKLSYKSYGVTTSVEFEGSDVSLDEIFQAFRTILIGATFSDWQYTNYIIEKAEEFLHDKNNNDE
jgi:hypothetical protein